MVHRVVCIGGGFVGGPFGAIIAYQCSDIQVTVVDKDPQRIAAWNSDCLPLYEPGLDEILADIRRRPIATGRHHDEPALNLRFSTDVERAIDEADIIVLCIDTPTKSFGIGQGVAADLTNLQAAVKTIARVASTDKIVVEKSTVPCGTAEVIRDLLHECSTTNAHFEVLSNPEFLSEGTTVADLLHPSRVLIGSQPTPSGYQAAATFAGIYEAWVPREQIKTMDCWSSELSKLAANAMLAQRLSSINSLSAICEAGGGDVEEVSMACGLDPRLGPGMMRSGLGWGGGCFEKDILDLVYIARSLQLDAIANYWMAVVEMNDLQKARFLRRILSCMHGTVRGKAIAILGFSFKKDTSDTKGSPAIPVVQGLLAEGAHLALYDPKVPASQIHADLGPSSSVRICPTAYEACEQAEAVVVVTDWDEFRMAGGGDGGGGSTSSSSSPLEPRCLTPDSDPEAPGSCGLDWERIAQGMQRPKFVFDGRNVLPGERIGGLGCRYVRVGRQSAWDASRMNRYPFHY